MKKLLSVLFLLFVHLDTFAVDPTQGPLQQHPALCQYGYNPNCGQNSSPPPPQKIIQYTTVYLPDKYGAISLDRKTNVVGSSANQDSLKEAKKAALKSCSNGGKNKHCEIIGWVRNGCFAAAGGLGGNRWILTTAFEERGKAESIAMERCQKKLSGCQIVTPEACSIP